MSCRYELKFFSQKFIDDSDAMVQYIGLPLQGLPGTSIDVVVLNPPETGREYSSIYGDQAIGTGHARSKLDSPQAWSAGTEKAGDWMRIDAGDDVLVHGVRTQRRAVSDQSVTAFTVQHSVDGFKWIDVVDRSSEFGVDRSSGRAATFTPSEGASSYSDAIFTSPVKARYIKITVVDFDNYPSMRAGLLIAGTAHQVAAAAAAKATAAAADKAKADADAAEADAAVVAAKAAVDAANADVDTANAVIDAASTGVGVFDPPESSRDYSSHEKFYGWSFIFAGPLESALEGLGRPWKPFSAKVDGSEWMQIDAGSAIKVFGVRIKQGGTAKDPERVTGFTVKHSTVGGEDKNNWTELGQIFTGSSVASSGSFDAIFDGTTGITARYIQIIVKSWTGYPSMRAGLLVDGKARDPADAALLRERVAAVAVRWVKVLESKTATKEQQAKSGTAKAAAKAAATAEDEAAVYDKLTGKMHFIGVSIDHFTYPQ